MGWLKVANTKDVGKGQMKVVGSGEKKFIVTNVDGKFYTFKDRCPYMNAPLHMGVLKDKIIECSLCHAKYNVTSGKKASNPKMSIPEEMIKKLPLDFLKKCRNMIEIMNNIETFDLQTYETKIEAGKVYINLPPSEMFKPPKPMVHPPPEELAEMFKSAIPTTQPPCHAEMSKPPKPMVHHPHSDVMASRKSTAKYCWNCGNSIIEKARFCDKCGRSLNF